LKKHGAETRKDEQRKKHLGSVLTFASFLYAFFSSNSVHSLFNPKIV